MLILTFLLSFFTPQQMVKENVAVKFEFTSMQLGKPTLAYYYYNVSLSNNTNKPVYVVLPRWFGEKITAKGNIWGSQYDSFEKIKGSTLFGNTSFTIIELKAKEKVILKDYHIETFDEGIQKKVTTNISYITCSAVTVGNYTLREYMEKAALLEDGLEYVLKDALEKNITIKTAN